MTVAAPLLALPDGSRRASADCAPEDLAEAAALLAAEVLGPRWLGRVFDELAVEVLGGLRPRPALRLAALPDGLFGQYAGGVVLVNVSLLTGRHPAVRPGRAFAEGRRVAVVDVVLHELVHARLALTTGDPGGGHGPAFSALAAEVAAVVGLPSPASPDEAAAWPVGLCAPSRYRGAFHEEEGSR